MVDEVVRSIIVQPGRNDSEITSSAVLFRASCLELRRSVEMGFIIIAGSVIIVHQSMSHAWEYCTVDYGVRTIIGR